MDVAAMFGFARIALGGCVAAVGLMFVLGGTLGLLRFPDAYTRLHAVNTSDGVGAVLVVLGLALMAPDWAVAIRLLLLGALLAALAPTTTHLLASAAHAGGLVPIAGRYVAPRPSVAR